MTVTLHESACAGLEHIVRVDPDYGSNAPCLLMVRSQRVPATRRDLPFLEVAFGQADASGRREGKIDANALVNKIWIEQRSQDGWIG